jgi:hypothetical protein
VTRLIPASLDGAIQAGSLKTISRLLTGLGRTNFARCWQVVISPLKQARVAFKTVSPRWTGPGFITAILSLFLIGALLFVRLNITPTASAANLIKLASAAEETLNEGADRAVHRVIDLEERAHAGGELIARRRIEIWRDSGRDLSVRRVYDEKGQLIAGEWATHSKMKGIASRTIYRRGGVPQIETSTRNPQTAIRKLDLWQLEPSAKDFAELIGRAETARVSEDSSVYVISYAGGQVAIDGMLLQATLTLRKPDLYPVEQTVVAQRGTETHLYRFIETSFERPSVRTVAPSVFEPDPELISEGVKEKDARIERKGDSPSFAVHPPVGATPELEMRVVYILDPFRARFGDQVNLIRAPDGVLVVKGIVDTEETRKEILRALSTVIDNPALTVQIETVADVLARRQQSPPDRVISREFAASDNAIPVYAELRLYFSHELNAEGQNKSGGSPEDDRVDQAIRSFAARIVGRSRRLLSHAIELRQLEKRFSGRQVNVLTADAKAKWASLLKNHVDALRRETSALRDELAPIFFSVEGNSSESGSIQMSTEADLTADTELLYKLTSSVDQTVRSAFTASSDAPAATLIKSPHFRVSLVAAERIAGRIRQAADL